MGMKKNPEVVWEPVEDTEIENFWTTDIYNRAMLLKPEEVWPICIISYKRGDKAASIRKLINTDVKVYLFIYEDDKDNYSETLRTGKNIVPIFCKGFRGVIPKRNFVLKTMREMGFKKYFCMDDDINRLGYTVPGFISHSKGGTGYRCKKQYLPYNEFFRVFQRAIMDVNDDKLALVGCLTDIGAAFQNVKKLPILSPTGGIAAITCMDTELLTSKGIHYETDAGWEDYSLQLDCYDRGLHVGQARWLTFMTPAMTPGVSISTTGELAWTRNSMNIYRKWGDCVRLYADKGQVNASIIWNRIIAQTKEYNHLIRTFDPEIMKFVDSNDYHGLNEYFCGKPEIKPKSKSIFDIYKKE